MIAADTSTWVAYFEGQVGGDVDLLERALADRQVVLPPVVLTELMSDPGLSESVAMLLAELPMLEATEGYWARAGRLRAGVLARKRRARLGDSLIAQSCLDHRVGLVARDRDFRQFAAHAGLTLIGTDAEPPAKR